jgi:tripartite-type tricarboxylate transporter receptor subunit TctC
MTLLSRRSFALGCATLPLLATGGHCAEPDWPSRNISYVVPYPPGGTTDILARLITAQLAPRLGTTIVVECKPGATGAIGTEVVARAAADGYTMLGTSTGPQSIVPNLRPKLGYHPIKSFEPVILIGTIPSVLIVGAASPYKSVADIVAAAKANPGKLTFGSGGVGTILQMSGELLKMRAGIDMVHVPYKGDMPAIQDVIGGHVDMMFAPVAPVLQFINGGQLRAIAVATPERLPVLPNTPTMADAGLTDSEAEQWQAIYVPAGTPPAIVTRLNTEIDRIIRQPDNVAKLADQGVTVKGGTPAVLAEYQAREITKWGQVIAKAGIKVD